MIIVGILLISCERKLPVIPKSDLLSLPSLTAKGVQTILNDSGRIQLIMTSPLIEQYDKADPPYSEFTSGIKVDVYNGKPNPEAKVTAKYGK